MDSFVLEVLLDVPHSLFYPQRFVDLHDDIDHLVFEPFQRDLEVEHGDHEANLGRVVWVAEFGGEVELEILGVVDEFLAEFEFPAAAFLDDFLGEDRLEELVDLLGNVLEEHRVAEGDGILELVADFIKWLGGL